jgi:hypothetical protein
MQGWSIGVWSMAFRRSARSLMMAAVPAIPIIILVPLVSGCAGSDGLETASIAQTPIAPGKARVAISRASALQYAAAPATITLNGEKVASVGSGGTAFVDIPAGDNTLAASAWSYPGEYKVKLNAVAGQTYRLEVQPRADSFGPSVLLGPIGGMIDSAANENAGAFEMKLVGS